MTVPMKDTEGKIIQGLELEKRIIAHHYELVVKYYRKLQEDLNKNIFNFESYLDIFEIIMNSLENLEQASSLKKRSKELDKKISDIKHNFFSNKHNFVPAEMKSLKDHVFDLEKDLLKRLRKDVHHSIEDLNDAEREIQKII